MRGFIGVLIAICSLLGNSFGQNSEITLNGLVDEDYVPLEMASVKLFKNGELVNEAKTNENGAFSFSLNRSNKYLIAVTKEGYITKKLEFDTYMPGKGKTGWVVEFAMGLFQPCPNLDLSLLDRPVSKIKFNPAEGNFSPDEEYAKKVSPFFLKIADDNVDCWNQEYNDLIVAGSEAFNNGDYAMAETYYIDALKIFPSAHQPQNQLKKIESERKNQQATLKIYEDAIKNADENVASGEIVSAIIQYKKALVFKSGDTYAENQITLLQEKLDQKESIHNSELLAMEEKRKIEEERLNALIDMANDHLGKNNFPEAIATFNKALDIKPGDDYILFQLDKVRKQLQEEEEETANLRAREQKYKTVLAEGNYLFELKEFEKALLAYQEAMAFKPGDALIKQKIIDMQQVIAERNARDEKIKLQLESYNNAVAMADELFTESDYNAAKAEYKKALATGVENDYPAKQINKIDELLSAKSSEASREPDLEVQFEAFITQGEKFFDEGKYQEAIEVLNKALEIKHDDGYTRALLAKSEKKYEDQKEEMAISHEKNYAQNLYKEAIRNGDNMLKNSKYNSALAFYNQALEVKTADAYALSQMRRAQELSQQAAQNESFQVVITSADALFENKNYEAAKKLYKDALALKHNDVYAVNRINEIDRLLINDRLKAIQEQENEAMYQAFLAKGNEAIAEEKWELASGFYKEAINLKPDESFPKQQLNVIQERLAIARVKGQYDKIIEEALKEYNAKNYDAARNLYAQASGILPSEEHPKLKLAEIDQQLAQIKEKENQQKANEAKATNELKAFHDLIAAADQNFEDAYYQDAKKLYQEALLIKAYEPYPKNRIKRIDETLAVLGRGQENKNEKSAGAAKNNPSILAEIKFASNKELEDYLEKLKLDYPPGVTQEVYKNAKSTTNRFVIIRADEVFEIREVKHSWGGIDYFRNGKPITMGYFRQQTEVREGEYFKKINK